MKEGTITRRMNVVLQGLEQQFQSMYCRRDLNHKLAVLKATGTHSNRHSVLADLFRALDYCGISYEIGKSNEYYEKLIKQAYIPGFDELEERMLRALFQEYKKYPLPEDFMLRIVNRMEKAEDDWSRDTLRVRILKQFIKYANGLKDAGYSGYAYIEKYGKKKCGKKPTGALLLEAVDDEIFQVLVSATEEQLKPKGTYGLLKLADDLAAGKFRTGGATKKALYLFAMAYDMTYGTKEQREQTDIEKNLFHDYYANNMMRFITKAYQGRWMEYDVNPSGQGINYKNFAEMIYIYYIISNDTPLGKIQRSAEMIQRVQQVQKEQGIIQGKPELPLEDVFSMSEPEFEQYMCQHYNCNTMVIPAEKSKKAYSVSPMQVEAEQDVAYQKYQEILNYLQAEGIEQKDCRYGLWFTDTEAIRKKSAQLFSEEMKGQEETAEEFTELLLGVDYFLKDAWSVLDAAKMSRTALIAAYYYYYNELNGGDGVWGFQEVFEDFKDGVDKVLEEAGYQLFSGKNIYDVLVAFSAYAYLKG